jgi:tripartite-type tricarboxylate transporter receptor subunit TctC
VGSSDPVAPLILNRDKIAQIDSPERREWLASCKRGVMDRRGFLTGAAAAGFAGAAFRPAFAQSFPANAIRIVVPTSGGTPPDILSRILATALSDSEGWNVVVERKAGNVMIAAAMDVLSQPADGHSLFPAHARVTALPALIPNAPFNLERDFAPVIKTGASYNVLVVSPSLPVNSVGELVAYLKKDPGRHTFSSGGLAAPAHLLGEMFKLETGVQATHVAYVEFPQAIADLVNGFNTYQFITTLPVIELIKTGKLKALAVASNKRIAALSNVPTIVEAGYPKLAAEDWAGIMVKRGTPAPVIAKLNAAINRAIKSEKVREAFAKIGFDPGGGSAEAFGALVHAEIARWSKVIKDAGIKINS